MNLVNLFGDWVDPSKIEAIECANKIYTCGYDETVIVRAKIHLSCGSSIITPNSVDDVMEVLKDAL